MCYLFSMIKKGLLRIFSGLIIVFCLFVCSSASASWIWTPETGRWINTRNPVKETPKEQLEYSLKAYENEEYKKALKEFQKLVDNYPKAKEAPEAEFYIGECFITQDKPCAAFRHYQYVIDRYPFSERAKDIVKKQYDLAMKMLKGEWKDERKKPFASFRGKNCNLIELFKMIIKNDPYGAFAAAAQYHIGQHYIDLSELQDARDGFEKVMNDYPGSEWAQKAQYQIAMLDARRSPDASYDQKITEVAIKELNEFVEENSDKELTEDAKNKIVKLREKEAENNFGIATFYEKKQNYKAAKLYYQTVVDKYSDTSRAKEALKKIQELGQKE